MESHQNFSQPMQLSEPVSNYLLQFQSLFASKLIDKAKDITPENHSIDDSQIMLAYLLIKKTGSVQNKKMKENKKEKMKEIVAKSNLTKNHFKDPALKKMTLPAQNLSIRLPNSYVTHPLNNRECSLSLDPQ